jgi:hypothetical protein
MRSRDPGSAVGCTPRLRTLSSSMRCERMDHSGCDIEVPSGLFVEDNF